MSERYHGLDLTRAVLMVLGVIYHTALVYRENRIWRVNADTGHIVFNFLASFLADFRMPAFYVVAGFFVAFTVRKYGTQKSMKDRMIRLAVPMIFIGFTFNPLMHILSVNIESPIGIKYFLFGEWLAHLWFIGNLLVYCYLSLLWIRYCTTDYSKRTSPITVILFIFLIIPTAYILIPMIGKKFYSGDFLFISFERLYAYFPYYVLGTIFFCIRTLIFQLMTPRFSILLALFYISMQFATLQIPPDFSWTVKAIFIQSANTALALFFISSLNSFKRKSRLVDNLVASSYTVYLLHMPVIVVLFHAIGSLTPNPFINFLVISITTYFMCHYFHHLILASPQSKWLLYLFNGQQKK